MKVVTELRSSDIVGRRCLFSVDMVFLLGSKKASAPLGDALLRHDTRVVRTMLEKMHFSETRSPFGLSN